ncbi:histidine kinase dimerization/phospho-acceptor domain-containing protein [Erythrobacteraceae bacterium WH01K]|nr:histidine kinase dimerization/phospho-acceptor domain-containing protein [Erythrobacteraceae bacterium WH01K]
MLFDDRLATVLRHRAAGDRAKQTQFRQLLDLLGRRQRGADGSLRAAAWLRLAALGETIPARARAAMIRDPGLRFHNPELAAHFAEDEPAVAAAALATAQLREDDWEALIPRLPIRARGFLRLRNDLPPAAMRLLDRLGISDRGLPVPEADASQGEEPESSGAASDSENPAPRPGNGRTPSRLVMPRPANDALEHQETGESGTPKRRSGTSIGTLVERIEAFQKERTRKQGAAPLANAQPGIGAPTLPLGDEANFGEPTVLGFAFTTDAVGRIDWADPQVAPSLVHMAIAPMLGTPDRKAFVQHRPLRSATATLGGAPIITGKWLCDSAPQFTTDDGRFIGHAGRMRRIAMDGQQTSGEAADANSHVRQMLHELRTPVNAIQGFAELIQQQLFGPVPHEYRALAAAIAGDSARMLAGFDELDRLAKLEAGAMELENGVADQSGVVAAVSQRLSAILEPRGAGFQLDLPETIDVALTRDDLEGIIWRILASLAAGLTPGETSQVTLVGDRHHSRMEFALPASMAKLDDIFAAGRTGTPGAASAGAFGQGIALRLARAEARAAGGDLARVDARIILTLPRLTAPRAEPSDSGSAQGASG